MNDDAVWAAVDRYRTQLADILASLAEEQWGSATLCEGWTVHDLAGHLTMPLLRPRQLVQLALRYPGGTNRLIRESARSIASRTTPEQLVQQVRATVGHHRPMIRLTCREALIDAIAHTLDLAVPLELPVEIRPDDVAEAADRVVGYGGKGSAKVFRRLPLEGLALRATDNDWSVGSGEEVTGSMADLFMLLTGRTTGLQLAGPGAARLAESQTG